MSERRWHRFWGGPLDGRWLKTREYPTIYWREAKEWDMSEQPALSYTADLIEHRYKRLIWRRYGSEFVTYIHDGTKFELKPWHLTI